MGTDYEGGEAGGEQPLRAASWQEPTMKKILNLCNAVRFRCDGCQFGLKDERSGKHVQKLWGWFSSIPEMAEALGRSCKSASHEHVSVTGPALAATAQYPRKLCQTFAKVLMKNRAREILEHVRYCIVNEPENSILAVGDGAPEEGPDGSSASGSNEARREPVAQDEEDPSLGAEEEEEPGTEAWAPEQILKKIRTIHANLGHPSTAVLCRMLREAGASSEILRAAEKYECPQCAQRGHARPHRTAQVSHATRKWETVSVDTFWWHSPHKDSKGNPSEHVIGVSFLDEASDYHVATIIRSGTKTQRVMSAAEFREAFGNDWLRVLPKPQHLRFDDEGAFRDSQLITWLEGQAIRLSVVAGEAAWQVGKHSRHLEVLKENMSLLSLEVGPEIKAKELLSCSLAAKNEMHQVSGYSPNQWCFGQERDRMQSFLQHGNHLPAQSFRENETFEASLQRAEAARRTFLKADSRRRVLRAARGQARRSESFEIGQLVYYYRKGRNATRTEPGWHGPARVVAIEKPGSEERNQTIGSVVWLIESDGTLCALIGVHVDDVLCCGSGDYFKDRIQALRQCFPFGSWKDLQQEATVFCGCEIKQAGDFSIDLNQERYAEGLSEIPMSRERRDRSQDPVTEPERKALRAALGALSWRATQSAPWLCASVSYLQGCFKEARVDDLCQTNKLIRLQRSYSQTPVRFTANIDRPVLLTYHDASYACRRDGSSQGGLLTMIVDQKIMQGKSSAYSPIAWQSRKLPRVCRSSTAAEIQTGSHSMDAHEFTKQMLVEWYNPETIPLKETEKALRQVPSIVVTDSKNLYDSVTRVETSGLQLEEKRLALEVLSIRERVAAIGTQFRWVDADQQLADGLSKPFQYNALLMVFQKGFVSLMFDDSFVSAKKKRAWHRKQYEKGQRSPTPDSAGPHRKESLTDVNSV